MYLSRLDQEMIKETKYFLSAPDKGVTYKELKGYLASLNSLLEI